VFGHVYLLLCVYECALWLTCAPASLISPSGLDQAFQALGAIPESWQTFPGKLHENSQVFGDLPWKIKFCIKTSGFVPEYGARIPGIFGQSANNPGIPAGRSSPAPHVLHNPTLFLLGFSSIGCFAVLILIRQDCGLISCI
jgi:hypothetical protein